MKYTDLIWDFNGTLLDDVEICLHCMDALLGTRGMPLLETKERYRQVFGFPVKEYYRQIGFDFSKESYETVALEWVEEYLRRSPDGRLYPDARKILFDFAEAGYCQTLLSATDSGMLEKQVQTLGIRDCFSEVWGLDDVYAHSKVALGERWRMLHPQSRALLIGDTLHDAQTAQAMKADCVLIADGHQSSERLEKAGVPVLENLGQLHDFL